MILTAILPVLRPRCPYKSPLGWALVWISSRLVRAWGRFWEAVWLSTSSFPFEDLADLLRYDFKFHNDWRARDAASRDDGTTPLSAAALETIDVKNVKIPGVKEFDAVEQHEQAQIHHLSFMLAWIQATSQDTRLLAIAEECTPRRTEPQNILALVAADFLFASDQLGMDLTTMFRNLDMLYSDLTVAGAHVEYVSLRDDWQIMNFDSDLWKRLRDLHQHHPYLVSQLARLFAHDLGRLVDDMRGDECLDVPSARFVMRTAALTAASMEASTDWTCTACLGPLFQRLLKEPRKCLPGLRRTSTLR